jgi:hypothetical protein
MIAGASEQAARNRCAELRNYTLIRYELPNWITCPPNCFVMALLLERHRLIEHRDMLFSGDGRMNIDLPIALHREYALEPIAPAA